jgi:hypothetical protein
MKVVCIIVIIVAIVENVIYYVLRRQYIHPHKIIITNKLLSRINNLNILRRAWVGKKRITYLSGIEYKEFILPLL